MVLEKEDIILVAQLLNTQKELSEELAKEENSNDNERAMKIKKEILKIQKKISEIL